MPRFIGILGLCLLWLLPFPASAQPSQEAQLLLDELGEVFAAEERPFDRYMVYHLQYHARLGAMAEGHPEVGVIKRVLEWEVASGASATFHQHAVGTIGAGEPEQLTEALGFFLDAAELNEQATPPSREDLYKLGEVAERLVAAGMAPGDLAGDKPGALGLLEKAIKVYKAILSSEELSDDDYPQRDRIVRDWIDLVSRDLSPILAGPAGAAFADAADWNGRMWDATSEGLGLVADAIERGELDMEAYQQVADRIERLANAGPWDSDTAHQFLKKWAEELPYVGKLLKAVWPEPVPEECRPINCDCDALVDWGLLAGPYIKECRGVEDGLKAECSRRREIVGVCHPTASGPNAFPR
jgi:tetratricopeptide (TPR) repeat protein